MTGIDASGLGGLTARLLERHRTLGESVVDRVVRESYAALRNGARVSAYLLVLTERVATERLAELARTSYHTVEFRGRAQQWRATIEAAAGGRWQAVDAEADVVVVSPGDRWAPREVVAVADIRSSPPTPDIVAAYQRGATAYISSAEPALLLAHLDAIARSLSGARHRGSADVDHQEDHSGQGPAFLDDGPHTEQR